MANGSMGSRSNSLHRWRCAFAAMLWLTAASPAALAQAPAEFPFEREMALDVKPLPGSKRVPMLEIFADGRAVIDLWCRSGDGRAEVKGDAITFTLGPLREEACTPERLQRDDEMATVLTQITQWRLEDDTVVLIGPTELRYRLSTH
jgi:heat shock protein HslJ